MAKARQITPMMNVAKKLNLLSFLRKDSLSLSTSG